MKDLKMASGCPGQKNKEKQEEKNTKLHGRMSRIKNKLVVMSGKGGVGKSTLAANLAVGLSLRGCQVGLLDVDVHGPSIPRLLSLSGEKPHADHDHLEPISWSRNLWVMSLGFLIPDDNEAVIWRGPVKMGLIRQFLQDVSWGDLDCLIVDCPPGTGDEPLTVLQMLGDNTRALIVTTPQAVAVDDVRRSISFCRDMKTPILGVVENMSGFVCHKCNEHLDIFNSGGGEVLAGETGTDFLGRIPIDPEIVRSGDEGYIYVKTHPESPSTRSINSILDKMTLEQLVCRQ